MPLLPLPPSNTKRYYLGVQFSSEQHHIMIRVADTVADGNALTDLSYVVSVIAPVTYADYTFNELLVSEKGSDIRNPVSGWTPIVGGDLLNQPVVDHPLSITARARSSTGRKCRSSLWGQVFLRDSDWVYVPDAGTAHATYLTTVINSPTYFLAIDGSKPVWKFDFTVQFNDHWVKQERP